MRLTKLLGTRYFKKDDKFFTWDLLEDKLGQLEDVEENKGCDLLVLEKVSQNWKIYSVWAKDYINVIKIVLWEKCTRPYMECWFYDKNMKHHYKTIWIDEYLSTWALTKEELEK